MKYFIYTIICTGFILLGACKKDQIEVYQESTDNLYLDYSNDSSKVTYTFAYNPLLSRDTVWVPVKLSGKRADHDRRFTMSVIDSGQSVTTAIENEHYEALKPFYVMPKDSGLVHVPIIVYNAEGLEDKTVFLSFRVSGAPDFDTKLPVSLRTRTLAFSNRLEKPDWWDPFSSTLGAYSRTKHQLFLIAAGVTDLTTPDNPAFNENLPRSLYLISMTSSLVNYPFAWVADHPEKGYLLEPVNDGTGDYYFYNPANPALKFHIKYLRQSDKYKFLDENGNEILDM